MRKKIVAGNWKMNKTFTEGEELVKEIVKELERRNNKDVSVIIAPPYIHLSKAVELTTINPQISISAQNCSDKTNGAFTGEVSAAMLKSVDCSYVIIGHSERRQYFNETNALLSDKIKQVLANDLVPIFCCGEILEERNAQRHFEIIKKQIIESLFHLNDTEINKIVIAYEPVWAIGTGLTASPEQAQEMHQFIRNILIEKYGENTADNISILYGGSCNPANAKAIFSQKDVDGGLIGGASLKAVDFVDIINSF